MHVQKGSSIPDHCRAFALSDKEKCFQSDCKDHTHTDACMKCQQMDHVLQDILKKTSDGNWDNADAINYKVK